MTEREKSEKKVLETAGRHYLPLYQRLEEITVELHESFPHYTGVYIYLVDGETLVLTNFRGRPTEHVRIPVGAGICGRAARDAATVTVDDVNADPDYIACSIETRSEIVVPILRANRVLGEIDIDSDVPQAFTPADRTFLENLAARLERFFPGAT